MIDTTRLEPFRDHANEPVILARSNTGDTVYVGNFPYGRVIVRAILIQAEDYAELSLSTMRHDGVVRRTTNKQAKHIMALFRVKPLQRLALSPDSVVRCWHVGA